MRQAYAHEAVVVLGPGSDRAAPGGAVTEELCGSWDHPPPCPFAPHHVDAVPEGDAVRVRVLFATDPADEPRARAGIERALAAGRTTGPDGRVFTWTLRSCGPAPVDPDETEHAARLVAT
jgi:hypothetical protein